MSDDGPLSNDWRKIAEKMLVEEDPEKVLELAQELNRALADQQELPNRRRVHSRDPRDGQPPTVDC